jgi:hypothetical protein
MLHPNIAAGGRQRHAIATALQSLLLFMFRLFDGR